MALLPVARKSFCRVGGGYSPRVGAVSVHSESIGASGAVGIFGDCYRRCRGRLRVSSLKLRTVPADEQNFGLGISLVLALTVLVVPMYAPYNQVLLLPAILVLARDRTLFTSRSRAVRFLYLAAAVALAWQWRASLCLSSVYLLGWRAGNQCLESAFFCDVQLAGICFRIDSSCCAGCSGGRESKRVHVKPHELLLPRQNRHG